MRRGDGAYAAAGIANYAKRTLAGERTGFYLYFQELSADIGALALTASSTPRKVRNWLSIWDLATQRGDLSAIGPAEA